MGDNLTEENMEAERRKLVQAATEWGYFSGAIKTRTDLWRGKRILDVGMGGGPHSVSFVEGGCKSYVGVDPRVGTDQVRDFRHIKDPSVPGYHEFPYSTDRIMQLYPNIHLYSGLLEDVAEQVKAHDVDVAMMAAVTEHLQHPHEVFRSIWEITSENSLFWFSHCNYYSWSGHHARPRKVKDWERGNPEHEKVVDWRHLNPDHIAYSDMNFNRIRLVDLRDLTNKYFEIIEWRARIEALDLLTPEIRNRYKKYTLEELLGQVIYVTGRRRDKPLDIDLSEREFHHPSDSYLAADDWSQEDIQSYRLLNSVFMKKGNQINSHSANDYGGCKFFETLNPGDRVRLTKFEHSLDLTIKEVITPAGATTRIKVEEDLPEKFFPDNYDQWQIRRLEPG